MLFTKRMSQERQDKIKENIDTLEKHGRITEQDFKNTTVDISATVRATLREYYGSHEIEGYRFVNRVLERFGSSQEHSLGHALVNGYENERLLLLKRPKDLQDLERLLDE